MSNVRNRGAKKIKILTLEDGKNWCKYFKTIFDKRHYEIYPADRLEEAEEFLENEHIDIVIVNIKLFKKFPSDKSGIILLEHIKARYSGLPSIVFTAYSAEEFDKNGYIRKYVRCVLRKPSRMDDAGPLYREVLNVRREILNGDDVRGVLNGELMEYADFSLHIGPDGYIRAISEQGEASDKIFVKIPDDIQEYLKKIEKNETDAGNLKFCGKRLYDIVFPPKIHTLLSQSEAVARERKQKIRIRLTIEPDSLASLPWELTYREERGYFLSQNPSTVLSHYLDMPLQQNPMKRPESFLNMLLIIANPSDQTPLDPDKWEKIITSALYKQTEAGKIKIRTVKKATRKEISKALLEVQPDIVQFVGHGIYHEGKGYLAMVDNQTGETWKVDDERFSTMFLGADDLLRLVCLATCESAKSDSPKGFLGIAPQIVQKGIPAVVAMRYSILISTAEIFLEEFYQAIAERKPVDWAVQWARNQVSLDKGLDNREFATPVLFMRAKDGNIFSENIHRESPAMQDEERNVKPINDLTIPELSEMNGEPQKTKVFISHASEDYEIAKRLYDDLKREGITPWIDGENLLVGQNWRETIPHIIRKSSHFLLVISKNSVSKTGYIQEEQRIALDFLNKFPPGKIFIIPARLDNTEPAHEKLRNLHWADLSDYDKGLAQILKALKSDNSGD